MLNEFLGYVIEQEQVPALFNFHEKEEDTIEKNKLLEAIYVKASPAIIPDIVDQLIGMGI